jgi:hypothetical protein
VSPDWSVATPGLSNVNHNKCVRNHITIQLNYRISIKHNYIWL